MFGCFEKSCITRQTIRVPTITHAIVLTVGILSYTFIDTYNPPHLAFYIILYTLDFIFASKFIFGFHLAFVDLNTEFKIMNAKRITRRYAKRDFILDVVSWLPLIIGMYVKPKWVKMFTLNRTVRIWYLQKYYDVCRNKLTGTVEDQHLIRFAVACLQPRCCALTNVVGCPIGVVVTNSTIEFTALGYSYVINLFTRGGIRDAIPVTTYELVLTTFIAMYSHNSAARLAGSYVNMIIIQNNTMDKYHYKINRIKLYLQGGQLSPAVFRRIWEYFLQLWALQQGEWMPSLIAFVPTYMKQNIMHSLYGYHLENHFLLSNTHKDCLRQVVVVFERRIYLPVNVIVENGYIENAMYFLHAGEVAAYDIHGNNEIQCFVLRSEVALTVTSILALRKNAW